MTTTFSPKRGRRALLGAGLLLLTGHLASRSARALPMFARRYGVGCITCHTSPPRLNEVGYQFRAAGFRMPDELGKPRENQPTRLTDYVGFRLQPRFDAVLSASGSEVNTSQRVGLFAAEGYFWYGPVSKYFSSQLKVSIWPDESIETEHHERFEGNLRFNYGKADHFVDIRAGVPHPMEGFGGSEYYVVSNSRPFIQELRTANFNQDTFFTPIGMHQAAITVGYHYKRTTVRGLISGGVRLEVDDDQGVLEGFGKKEPFSKPLRPSDRSGPDFQLFFNQILHPEGGNVSLYYYKGQSFLPRLDMMNQVLADAPGRRVTPSGMVRTTDLQAALAKLPFFENDFYRLALYAGYPIKRVNLLYGIQRGRDSIGTGGQFTSLGHFMEAMARVKELSAVGVRYDWFDPARNKKSNEMRAITPYVKVWLHSELRIAAEYQHLSFKRGSQPGRTDDVLQLRLYWVR